MSELHRVNTDKQNKLFKEHLQLGESNKRIFFSAGFGSGKSDFLSNFFRENSDKYRAITVYPSEYSTSNNADVFELIKHDILLSIIENYQEELKLESLDVGSFTAAKLWIEQKFNPLDFATSLAKITNGGKEVAEVKEEMSKIFKKIKQYKKELEVDEEQEIIDYLIREKQKTGSIRELDGMTFQIKELIARLKGGEEKLETVLVIDDMDRIDPEHLFRIINIFTAHFDSRYDANKFDFDKVILVGDIENIRNLYHNKYGRNVDFKGYLSKFYSHKIYTFSLVEELVSDVMNLFVAHAGDKDEKIIKTLANDYYHIENGSLKEFNGFLTFIFEKFISSGYLRIRDFVKIRRFQFTDSRISLDHGFEFNRSDYPILIIFDILLELFPTKIELTKCLEDIYRDFNADYSSVKFSRRNDKYLVSKIISLCVPFIVREDEFLTSDIRHDQEIKLTIENEMNEPVYFVFRQNFSGTRFIYMSMDNFETEEKREIIAPNPFYFLYRCMHGLIQKHFI